MGLLIVDLLVKFAEELEMVDLQKRSLFLKRALVTSL